MVVAGGGLRIGERIELRRRQRGLSRKVLADLVGRSEEWLRQVERGMRRLDSLAAIVRLAEVLHISDLESFVDWPFQEPAQDRSDPAMSRLRLTLIDHDSVDAFGAVLGPVFPGVGIATWDHLRVELDVGWLSWSRSASRYTESIARVPRLLAASRALARDADCLPAGQLTSGPYRLARVLLTRLGDHHLAWHAAQRALDLAHQGGQHAARIASAWHVAVSLFKLGRCGEAGQYALAAARRIVSTGQPADLARWGALHLLAAEAAAADLDAAEALRLLDISRKAADRLGGDCDGFCLWFGPTEVAITGIQICLRLGRTDEALRMAKDTEIPVSYPVGRRARHHIGLALGYSRRGEDAAAVFALTQAEQACPEDLRYDATARRILHHLIGRHNRSLTAELTRLAAVAGLE